jgi:hypothetical protein
VDGAQPQGEARVRTGAAPQAGEGEIRRASRGAWLERVRAGSISRAGACSAQMPQTEQAMQTRASRVGDTSGV